MTAQEIPLHFVPLELVKCIFEYKRFAIMNLSTGMQFFKVGRSLTTLPIIDTYLSFTFIRGNLHTVDISSTLQSRTGKYRVLQGNPCNENMIPAMRTTGFSLWELTYREFPVTLTGFGFAMYHEKTVLNWPVLWLVEIFVESQHFSRTNFPADCWEQK